MLNDLNLLRIFYTVATEESVSRAALKLHISQPAVSQNIKLLEQEIGFSLFIRTNKGVKLTNEASEMFSYCKNIFRQVDLLNQTHSIFQNEDKIHWRKLLNRLRQN